MSEGSGQKFCGNCGTEIRSGISFCVSCGKPVNGGPASSGPDNPVPPPTPPRSLADTLKEAFQGLTERFSNARSASSGASLRGLPNKAINWFKDLPSVPKLIIVGLILLLLLTVLSPVARVVAIIVFVASSIALAIRAIRRESIKGWGIAAVTSLVLVFLFGSISSAIYGTDSTGQDRAGTGDPPVYVESDGSGTRSSIVTGVQGGDARFQAYKLCHSYFLNELANEFGTSEDAEEVAYVAGDQIGDSKETKEAAYGGCMTALEEEAVDYLPPTEANIIQMVKEGGTGDPPDEVWDGTFDVSQGVDTSEVPDTDLYGKPTDLEPTHWFLVEHCSSGRLYTYQANPWSADVYQESSLLDTNGEPVC